MPKTTLLNSPTALKIPLEMAIRKWTLETGWVAGGGFTQPPITGLAISGG